jgi:hypothetical protein
MQRNFRSAIFTAKAYSNQAQVNASSLPLLAPLVIAGFRVPYWDGEFNRSTQHYSPKLSGVGLKRFLH